jgi:penicillin-binding protein 2
MGKINPRQWVRLKARNYRMDSRIGRLGVESVFERQLRGTDGAVKIEVDAHGRIQKILRRLPWKDGRNVHLTLDAIVQKAADEGLSRTSTRRGAVVALDPSNGDILAFAAAPDFDPNQFLGADPFSLDYSTFVPSSVPEFDRAISGLYAPGSIFKTIVSVAGINEGKLDPTQIVFCPGYFRLGRRTFLCWNHRGHGNVDFFTGLAESCDVYFYKMGLVIGADLIEKYEKIFHLGKKTGIALKGEEAGNLFGPETSMQEGKTWVGGNTLNLAIGQGRLLVTPIQMAVVAAALANHGTLWRPQYLRSIAPESNGEILRQSPQQIGFVRASKKTWNLLDQAMALVVASGTARGAYIKGIEVWGKTGTAQNSSGKDHAWFIAFAAKPGQAPSIAVSVLVENGGHGASAAVPIARQVIAAAFRVGKKIQYQWPKSSPKKIDSSSVKGETL